MVWSLRTILHDDYLLRHRLYEPNGVIRDCARHSPLTSSLCGQQGAMAWSDSSHQGVRLCERTLHPPPPPPSLTPKHLLAAAHQSHLSLPCSLRLSSERLSIPMPSVLIGLRRFGLSGGVHQILTALAPQPPLQRPRKRQTGLTAAMQVIPNTPFGEGDAIDAARESLLAASMSHPNVVRTHCSRAGLVCSAGSKLTNGTTAQTGAGQMDAGFKLYCFGHFMKRRCPGRFLTDVQP